MDRFQPLWMPRGSVRALIALALIGALVYLAVRPDNPLDPKEYATLVGVVLAFYFAGRSGAPASPITPPEDLMAVKDDLQAAIAKVATDLAAARAADQAEIASLQAKLAAAPAGGASDAELQGLLDQVNAIDGSLAAPAPAAPADPVAVTADAPAPVVDRTALPFDPTAT